MRRARRVAVGLVAALSSVVLPTAPAPVSAEETTPSPCQEDSSTGDNGAAYKFTSESGAPASRTGELKVAFTAVAACPTSTYQFKIHSKMNDQKGDRLPLGLTLDQANGADLAGGDQTTATVTFEGSDAAQAANALFSFVGTTTGYYNPAKPPEAHCLAMELYITDATGLVMRYPSNGEFAVSCPPATPGDGGATSSFR